MFPKTVEKNLEWGIEGDRAGQNVVNGYMGIVKTSANEGAFVFHGQDADDRNNNLVDGSGVVVAGFAERWMTRIKYDPTVPGSLSVAAGESIHCQTTGDFFAVATTQASAGQEVFAQLTDGKIVTGAASDTPPAGTAKTGFFVRKVDPSAMATDGSVPAGSLVAISSYIER